MEILEIRNKYDGSSEERAIAHAAMVKNMHCVNVLVICQFSGIFKTKPAYEKFLNAVTGWNLSVHDFLEVGERVAAIRQAVATLFTFRGIPSQYSWITPTAACVKISPGVLTAPRCLAI